jgi:hypothetical protein
MKTQEELKTLLTEVIINKSVEKGISPYYTPEKENEIRESVVKHTGSAAAESTYTSGRKREYGEIVYFGFLNENDTKTLMSFHIDEIGVLYNIIDNEKVEKGLPDLTSNV